MIRLLCTRDWYCTIPNIKDYAAAERAISRYMELSPDLWASQTLAANYKAQGKIDRWLETLERFLANVEDLGLDHARVRVDIADYYMGLKQWDKAQALRRKCRADVGRVGNGVCGTVRGGRKRLGSRRRPGIAVTAERYPDGGLGCLVFIL